ncbi:MAG: TIGR04255 family protein [Pseudomonadota bacterium]
MATKNALPKFDSPPVIETVFSAQFSPLPGYKNAHSGWFWKNYLPNEWAEINHAPPITDVLERFGDERRWAAAPGIAFAIGDTPDRLQIMCSDRERMIQIQNSRFAYNWKHHPGSEKAYPGYEVLLPEFEDGLNNFKAFVADAHLGDLNFNQWEVIYVNHIPKGDLWNTTNDWSSIIPSLVPPPATDVEGQKFDTMRCEWQYVINEDVGRLYLSIAQARIATEKSQEVMEIRLTARGPIQADKGIDLLKGLEIGHASIVNTFAAITSVEAHQHWKRRV